MNFSYTAKTADGKTIKGSTSAVNEADALKWIRSKGWIPLEVASSRAAVQRDAAQTGGTQKPKTPTNWSELLDLSPRVKLRDKYVFFRQLSTMITAGVPVASAIETLRSQTTNKRLQRAVGRVHSRVSAGITLGQAFKEQPEVFDSLMTSLVRSGEESGMLDATLSKLASFIESQHALRKKIVSAFTYPIAVISIAILVLGVMVTVVVPQFQKAFENLNIKMPFLTMMTFRFGNWMRDNWYTIPLAILILVIIIRTLRKIQSLKIYIDSFFLKMPVFGDIIFMAAVSRSYKTMAQLLRSGLPVLQSLEMAGDVASNERIKRSFLLMRDAASMGATLNSIMREKKLFPPMIIHMVAIGEETGKTDEMFGKIADWYEMELEEKVKRLSSTLEPILILFVGVIVAFMAISIFLPIISAIQAFI